MRAGASARASAVPRCVYRAATCVGWPARRGSCVPDVYLWPKKYFIIIIRRYGVPVGSLPSFPSSFSFPPFRSVPLSLSREGTGANERARAMYLYKEGPVCVLSLSSPLLRLHSTSVSFSLVLSRRRDTIAQRDYQKIIRISIEGPATLGSLSPVSLFYNEYDDGHATVRPARCRFHNVKPSRRRRDSR